MQIMTCILWMYWRRYYFCDRLARLLNVKIYSLVCCLLFIYCYERTPQFL